MSKHVSLSKTPTSKGSLRKTLTSETSPPAATPRATAPAAPSATPAYDELVRKEARLRSEQVDEIARLRRRLNSARNAAEKPLPTEQRSPSLQDHVITRAAITYLLENADAIDGWTEEGILESLRRLKG
ncbi:hypothetical protein [Brachybacterium alimentarium]|uniref:hypothetical protein n=1 Tax=Brachybacterium alimentarium TaxID=47845 RepID=UPI003FCF92F7